MEGYFERVVETLTGAGYRWYETANFCRTGADGRDLRARHNLGYWLGRDYLGIGVGAVSTVAGTRWRNAPQPAALPRRARPRRASAARGRAARRRRRRRASGCMLGLRLDEPLELAGLGGAVDRDGARAAAAARPDRSDRRGRSS